MRLVPITAGTIDLNGIQIHQLENDDLRQVRQHMQIIFQDPYSSLNPRVRAGAIIREPMDLMNVGEVTERDDEVKRLMSAVGLRAEQRALFPHQFSGGMRQRVSIAIALLNRPELIIADEPTTALDVTIQAQILYEAQKLCRETGTALIWITHDLSVIAGLADDVAVMYAGRVVEYGEVDEVLDRSLHPYTHGLIGSVPSRNRRGVPLHQIPGMTPSLLNLPPGCAFRERCPQATDVCSIAPEVTQPEGTTRKIRCHSPVSPAESAGRSTGTQTL